MGDYTVDDLNNGNVELKNWNLQAKLNSANGVSLAYMFYNCPRFNGDLSNWTIKDPWDTQNMFYRNREFRGTGLSTWTFVWTSINTLDMSSMFRYCEEFEETINNWPAKSMTNSSDAGASVNYDNYGNGCDEMPDQFKNSDIDYFSS